MKKILMVAAMCGIVMVAKAQARPGRFLGLSTNTLDLRIEQVMPFDEALELAKKNDGKGLYQLAMIYSEGKAVPMNRDVAFRFLAKSSAAGYGPAILVDGLCDEGLLVDPTKRNMLGRRTGVTAQDYFGSFIYRSGSNIDITNEVAYGAVMAKYQKALDLGVLSATNAIENLKRRLGDAQAAVAKAEQERIARVENNDKVNEAFADVFAETNEDRAPSVAPGMSLRQRREARMAQRSSGPAANAAREEQRAQLAAIQEELRLAREARQIEEDNRLLPQVARRLKVKGVEPTTANVQAELTAIKEEEAKRVAEETRKRNEERDRVLKVSEAERAERRAAEVKKLMESGESR